MVDHMLRVWEALGFIPLTKENTVSMATTARDVSGCASTFLFSVVALAVRHGHVRSQADLKLRIPSVSTPQLLGL